MSTLDHHVSKVQVWNGSGFAYVDQDEANKLVKAGTHQISTGLSSSQLKFPNEFKPKSKNKKPGKEEAGKYKTREMTAK